MVEYIHIMFFNSRIFSKYKKHAAKISFALILLLGVFLFSHVFADTFATVRDGNWNDGATWGATGFNGLTGVARDSSGNTYAVDPGNHRVVKLDSTGKVTDVILDTDTAFDVPSGITLDSTGNIYVTDTSNNLVVKFNSSGSTVSEFSDSFNTPAGVAVDISGNIYVVDSGRNNVIKLGPTGTELAVFTAGDSLSSPSGVTLDTSGNIYIADSGNNRIVKLDPDGNVLDTFTDTGSAFYFPTGISLDTLGNMYVADRNNNRIVKLDSTGTVLDTFTDSTTAFSAPQAVAVDSSGIYVGDYNNYRVVKLDSSGNQLASYDAIRSREGIDYPGATNDAEIQNYVTLTANQSIHTVHIFSGGTLNLNGHTLTVTGNFTNEGTFVASSGTLNLSGANQVVSGSTTFYNLTKSVSSADTLYFNLGTQTITGTLSLNGTAGNLLTIRQPSVTSPAFNRKWGEFFTSDVTPRPNGVAVDTSGNIYVADTNGNRIVKLNSAGAVVSIFTNPDSPMSSPFSVTLDPSGNMYISDQDNDRVLKLAPDGSQLASFTAPLAFSRLNDIALDMSGNMYVSDQFNNRIVKMDPAGSVIDVFTDSNTLSRPEGVALDSSGNIYVSDRDNDRIVKLAPDGSQLASFTYTDFTFPLGLTVDHSGNIYVINENDEQVYKLDSGGSVLAHFGDSDSPFYNPTHLALDSSGNIYVTDSEHSRVAKLSSSGTPLHSFGALYTAAPSGKFSNPTSVSTDSGGNVYVADCGQTGATNRIQEFDSSGTFIGETPSPGSDDYEQIWCSHGEVIDPSGNIYVSDSYNNRIVKFDSSKNFVTAWGSEGTAENQFENPTGIIMDSSQNIYVEDTYNHRIQKFDKDGHFILMWGWGVRDGSGEFQICTSSCQGGGIGDGAGEFSDSYVAMNLATDSHGNVYVPDTYNHRVQKFDKNGNFILMWGWGVSDGVAHLEVCTSSCRAGMGGAGEGQFNTPSSISIDSSDTVYVGNVSSNIAQMFSTEGAYLGKFGENGSGDGQFTQLVGVATGRAGNVFALDTSLYQVSKFTPVSGYTLNPQGSVSVSFLSVAGATNAAVSPVVCTNGCVDGGGNVNWTFPEIHSTPETHSPPPSNGPPVGSGSGFVFYPVLPPKQITTAPAPSVKTQPTLVNTTPVNTFVFTRNLLAGSVGIDVQSLQKYLNTHGFSIVKTGPGSPGNETTNFGVLTRASLIRFQKANHITPASGYFGPITRGVMNRH